MKAKFLNAWYWLQNSLWFVPAIMISLSIFLAVTLPYLEQRYKSFLLQQIPWLYTGGSEGARQMLQTISSSIITVAGVIFSITMLAFAQASTQFGPRILRLFMNDKANQIVLGMFISTFIYGLVLLRGIPLSADPVKVPHLSVSIGFLLALVNMALLIFFIHHVSEMLQVDKLIATLSHETEMIAKKLYPEKLKSTPQQNKPALFNGECRIVRSKKEGYIQRIDTESLMELASRQNCFLRILRRPGDFVEAQGSLLEVRPKQELPEDILKKIDTSFIMGIHRTSSQDIGYNLNLLVEIAVRALSPAINAPASAMMCLDRIGALLSLIARRCIPENSYHDSNGVLRVQMHVTTLGELTGQAFDPIHHFGKSNPEISIHLFHTLKTISEHLTRLEDFNSISEYTQIAHSAAGTGKKQIDKEYKSVQAALMNRWAQISENR